MKTLWQLVPLVLFAGMVTAAIITVFQRWGDISLVVGIVLIIGIFFLGKKVGEDNKDNDS